MAERKLRTAVLVVHGMGSQRPLETVGGIVNAVWFDNDKHDDDTKRVWTHPQPSGVDIDLTVKTTSAVEGTSDKRNIDFHELYWAHHMSETKAVAVLLWLFELARRGPSFKTGLNGLWWCGAVFLCLLLLSVALISFRLTVWIADVAQAPEGVVVTILLMVSIAMAAGLLAAAATGWWRLCKGLAKGLLYVALVVAVAVLATYLFSVWASQYAGAPFDWLRSAAVLASIFLPIGSAYLATRLLMGRYGLRVFSWTIGLSLLFYVGYSLLARCFNDSFTATLLEGRLPWSMASNWSVVAAWTIIGAYVVVNAAFLQPYLGDAARYFRSSPANVAVRRAIRKDAVDTLDQLHRSRNYDRIVVVAHSLGTVVAYDMLRAYYSRICPRIAIGENLNPEFDEIDKGGLDCVRQRKLGRALVAKLARASAILSPAKRGEGYKPATNEDVDAWLVTDFVTLGSPLTHAVYLIADENDGALIDDEFAKRIRERELPTCPPAKLDRDGLLAFKSSNNKLRLHHGGLFGMTRWTNLYFPAINIFWGDAIGGKVAPVFGECVVDVPVSTDCAGNTDGFKHTSYWKTDCEPDKRNGPHLAALREAVNLEDK